MISENDFSLHISDISKTNNKKKNLQQVWNKKKKIKYNLVSLI